jgi:hypothetical protein
VRGGRSLRDLDRTAAAARGLLLAGSRLHAQAPPLPPQSPPGPLPPGPLPPQSPALVFLAVSVDALPHSARLHGPATWPHLRHYWIDGHTVAELGKNAPLFVCCDAGVAHMHTPRFSCFF